MPPNPPIFFAPSTASHPLPKEFILTLTTDAWLWFLHAAHCLDMGNNHAKSLPYQCPLAQSYDVCKQNTTLIRGAPMPSFTAIRSLVAKTVRSEIRRLMNACTHRQSDFIPHIGVIRISLRSGLVKHSQRRITMVANFGLYYASYNINTWYVK